MLRVPPPQFVPRAVPALASTPIAAVACGGSFTMFLATLAAGGRVFVAGEGRCGQLGQGAPSTGSDVPLEVRFNLAVAVADAPIARNRSDPIADEDDGTSAGSAAFPAALSTGIARFASDGRGAAESKARDGKRDDGPLTAALPAPVGLAGGYPLASPHATGAAAAIAAGRGSAAGGHRGGGNPHGDVDTLSTIDARAVAIAAGGGHCLVVTASRHVFIWGASHGWRRCDHVRCICTPYALTLAALAPRTMSHLSQAQTPRGSWVLATPRRGTYRSCCGIVGCCRRHPAMRRRRGRTRSLAHLFWPAPSQLAAVTAPPSRSMARCSHGAAQRTTGAATAT